jgi:hypothetical protein
VNIITLFPQVSLILARQNEESSPPERVVAMAPSLSNANFAHRRIEFVNILSKAFNDQGAARAITGNETAYCHGVSRIRDIVVTSLGFLRNQESVA